MERKELNGSLYQEGKAGHFIKGEKNATVPREQKKQRWVGTREGQRVTTPSALLLKEPEDQTCLQEAKRKTSEG